MVGAVALGIVFARRGIYRLNSLHVSRVGSWQPSFNSVTTRKSDLDQRGSKLLQPPADDGLASRLSADASRRDVCVGFDVDLVVIAATEGAAAAAVPLIDTDGGEFDFFGQRQLGGRWLPSRAGKNLIPLANVDFLGRVDGLLRFGSEVEWGRCNSETRILCWIKSRWANLIGWAIGLIKKREGDSPQGDRRQSSELRPHC